MDERRGDVRAILETTPARWLSLTETLPEDLLRRSPAPGEWSALECLRHLRDAEQVVFPVRVRAFLAGQDLVPYDPDRDGSADGGESPAALAAEFARLRTESLALLRDGGADDLERRVTHREYGPVRLGELLHEWAAHDLVHTVQAERALMQPFIAGSGPWRATFAEHEVGRDDA